MVQGRTLGNEQTGVILVRSSQLTQLPLSRFHHSKICCKEERNNVSIHRKQTRDRTIAASRHQRDLAKTLRIDSFWRPSLPSFRSPRFVLLSSILFRWLISVSGAISDLSTVTVSF